MGKRYDSNHRRVAIKTSDDLDTEMQEARATLRTHAQRAQALYRAHQQRVKAIRQNEQLSGLAKTQQIAASKAQMAQEAAALAEERAAAKATLADAFTWARTDTRDSATQLLDFQRQQAAWTRAQKLHAAGQDWTAIIRAAGASGDLATLAALREELPAELIGLEKSQPGYTKAVLEMVSQAETPHVSDLERAVRAAEADTSYLDSASTFNERVLEMALNDPQGVASMHYLQGPDRDAIPLNADGE